jgi:hypothetical protein
MPQLCSAQALRQELERKRREITACDAQFNGLLEDRRRILAGLRLLDSFPSHDVGEHYTVDLAAFKKQAQLGDILG